MNFDSSVLVTLFPSNPILLPSFFFHFPVHDQTGVASAGTSTGVISTTGSSERAVMSLVFPLEPVRLLKNSAISL